MSLLHRLRRGSRASDVLPWPTGPIASWPSGEAFEGQIPVRIFGPPPHRVTVEVVGESHYQGRLHMIADGFDVYGPHGGNHLAALMPEPDNPSDPSTVRVVIVASKPGQKWGKVGHLSRDDAAAYRPVIDRLAALGWLTVCHASLRGGEIRVEDGLRNNIGVELYLGTPEALMEELDADQTKPSWS